MRKYSLIMLFLILTSCSIFNDICCRDSSFKIDLKLKNKSIAIITFNVKGAYLAKNIGDKTANQLSNELFSKLDVEVIDRSIVREGEKHFNVRKAEFLNEESISKISDYLNCHYLIIGEIIQSSSKELLNNEFGKNLYFSFRILDSQTTEILGVYKVSCEFESGIDEVITKLIGDFIKEYEELEWVEE